MCNPRRIRVTATRELAEAWQEEIARTVTRTADATGEARLREPLDASVGGPTLVMLERALATAEGWTQADDTFRYELAGGYVAYHAATQELELVAQATAEVTAAGTAASVVGGQLAATIEAGGVGVYYDDGYNGITEDDARRAAEEDARRNLENSRRELLTAAREAEESRLADDLDRTAGERADAELARVRAARVAELREQAVRRLTAVGIQGRNVFHQVLAGAYRDAILAFARSRGAGDVRCSEQDGVIDIEFVMEA